MTVSATISDANVSAVNARLAAVGYRGPLIATGVYTNPVDFLAGTYNNAGFTQTFGVSEVSSSATAQP